MKRQASEKGCQWVAPDGGWGWIALAASTIICLCSPSIVGCFGLILWDIRRSMETSAATTAFVASIAQALNFLSTPFVAMLGYTFSFRKIAFAGGLFMSSGLILAYFAHRVELLYLTLGLLGGIGFGFSAKSSLFVVNEYFDKRRGLATGTFYSGAALGRFVFPLIVHNLLETYGFRGTLLVWGAIMANICVCACLYQPPEWHFIHVAGDDCHCQLKRNKPKEKTDNKNEENTDAVQPFLTEKPTTDQFNLTVVEEPKVQNGNNNVSATDNKVHNTSCFTKLFKTLDYSVFRIPRFNVVAVGYICSSFANVNTYVFLPPLGRSLGFNSDETAWLVPSLGIGEIFGRLLIPWMVDHHLFRPSYAYIIGVGVCASLSFIITFPMSYYMVLFLSFGIGVSCGSATGISTVLSVEAVGKKKLSSAISFTQFGQGVFTLPSGFILGAIRDVTGSYHQCFYVISAVYSISLLLWIVEIGREIFSKKIIEI